MSKGLEAIQEYKRVTCPNCQYRDKENCDVVCFSNIVEKELMEKETQDDYIKMLEDRIDNLETSYLRNKKALEIIKECLVSEFKFFEKDGEYFIVFYFDELHQLLFKLKNKEEYDLLKEVLLCN